MFAQKEHFLLLKKIYTMIFNLGNGLPIIFSDYVIFSAEFFDIGIFNLFKISDFDIFSSVITKKKAESLNIKIVDDYQKILCGMDDISYLIGNKKLSKEVEFVDLEKDESECAKIGIHLMKFAKFLPMIIFHKIDSEKRNELMKKYEILEMTNYEFETFNKIKFNFVDEVCRTKVALRDAEKAGIIVFRDFPFFGKTHLAIIVGDYDNLDIKNNNPIVRIHSGCYTGDLLRSLQCDCYEQLHKTIEFMNNKWEENEQIGIIVYQAEDEGRAIGLANKIRTYDLQSKNCNTISANHAIGYEDDERDFTVAMKILKKLNVKECDLITNNPNKIKSFSEEDILVKNRIHLEIKNNLYNSNYLNIKKERMGHLFSE